MPPTVSAEVPVCPGPQHYVEDHHHHQSNLESNPAAGDTQQWRRIIVPASPSVSREKVSSNNTSNPNNSQMGTQLFDGSSEMFSRWSGNGHHGRVGRTSSNASCPDNNKSSSGSSNAHNDLNPALMRADINYKSLMKRLSTDIASLLPANSSPRSSFSGSKHDHVMGGKAEYEPIGEDDVMEQKQQMNISYHNGASPSQLEANSCSYRDPSTTPGNQGSGVTIFALWNVLMGTSLLCLPWALHQSGLVMGIFILLVMTWVCYYTANMILTVPQIMRLSERFQGVDLTEFCDVCRHLLGPWAAWIAMATSFITLWGAVVVYWILMTNFLYHVVNLIYDHLVYNVPILTDMSAVICPSKMNANITTEGIVYADDDQFHGFWTMDGNVPWILALVMFPIVSIRSPTALMKFNAYGGTFSISCLLTLAVYKAYSWGFVNIDLNAIVLADDVAADSVHYLPLFKWTFFRFTGVLSLALFIHNCIINFMQVNRHPENNSRDVGAAYSLVGVTYSVISLFIYISFPIDRACLEDNLLNNFNANDILAFLIRFLLFLQLMSLYPTLLYLLRTQTFATMIYPPERHSCKGYDDKRPLIKHTEGSPPPSPRQPSCCDLLTFNAFVVGSCILFAMYFPQIGTIIRFCGAIVGLVYIFTLPPITYVAAVRHVTRQFKAGQQLSGMVAPPKISAGKYLMFAAIIIIGIANCVGQFFP